MGRGKIITDRPDMFWWVGGVGVVKWSGVGWEMLGWGGLGGVVVES